MLLLWKEGLNVFYSDVSWPFFDLRINEYLDLARQVNTIYHSAAAVNFIAPFAELEEVTSTSTVEILRFTSPLTPKEWHTCQPCMYFLTPIVLFVAKKKAPVGDLHTGLVTVMHSPSG